MKVAREKGAETIVNPAPAIPLPEEAYRGLGHLIVNETEAAILSGIEKPTSWDEVASVFIQRGVSNVIITLGGEVCNLVRQTYPITDVVCSFRVYTTRPQSKKRSLNQARPFQQRKSRLSIPRQQATLLWAPTLLQSRGGRLPGKTRSLTWMLR